jgi:hypothetical protein
MHPYGRGEFELPNLDFLGDVEELRARALDKLRAMGGKPHPRDRYEGGDKSGSIVVAIDAKGFVREVDIRRDWRDALSVEDFPSALFEAYMAGVQASLEMTALAELAQDEEQRKLALEREEAEREAAWRGEEIPPRADEQDEAAQYVAPPEGDREWHAWVWDSLYAIGDQMHRVDLAERRIASPVEERTFAGPYGYLKVRHREHTILGITGDPVRIRMAEPHQLRTEALDVFRNVQHGREDH